MMKRWQQRILIATLPALLPAMTWSFNNAERVALDGVAAFVNQRGITMGDVSAMVAPAASELSTQYTGPELERRLHEVTRTARRRLIDRALIVEAYERGEMRIPESFMESRIREIEFDNFRGDYHRMLDALAQEGLTQAAWREQIREEIIVSFMREMNVSGRITISPADLRQAYNESRDRYLIPARARLRVIMIRGGDPDAEDLAASLVARLRDSASFEELASTYSEGRHADKGGNWGWINLHELRPELADPARELPLNQVSDVITVNNDDYIIQVVDRREERIQPIAEVHDELERKIRRQKSEDLYRRWIARLESNAAVYKVETYF